MVMKNNFSIGVRSVIPLILLIWFISLQASEGIHSHKKPLTKTTATKAQPTQTWDYSASGILEGAAIGDSTMYVSFGEGEKRLYNVNLRTGKKEWQYPTSGYGPSRQPTTSYIDGLSHVFLTAGKYVVALTDRGNRRDQLFKPIEFYTDAGIPYPSPDDSSFYVTYGSFLTKREIRTGKRIWTRLAPLASIDADMVVFNDELYVALEVGIIIKYDTDGTPLGINYAGASVKQPLLVKGGTLYVSPESERLYAFSTSNMRRKWRVPFNLGGENTGPAYSSTANNSVYVALENGVKRIADTGESGSEVWYHATEQPVQSGPIEYNGYVFYGRNNGGLYMLNDSTGTPVDNAWPWCCMDDNADMGPWIDPYNLQVIFGTSAGELKAFSLSEYFNN